MTLFNLKYPIFQAPTGSIAVPELCAAVSAAGGLGAMALTWANPEEAARQIRQVLERTKNPFQVNFALAFPPISLEAALEAGAPVVTFSWGDPRPHLSKVRAVGAKFGIQVTTGEGARRALQYQPDFLICQGVEAGGHVQATQSLWQVLTEVVLAADKVPVIAAGGIGDGDGIGKALNAGATGAMLGTRFVATIESGAHPEYKRKLLESSVTQTALTVCFDGNWPYAAQRVLRNPTLEAWEAAGCPPKGQRPGEGEVVGLSANGEAIYRYEDTAPRVGFTGDALDMCCYAGTSVSFVNDLPSATDLVPRLWAETQNYLDRQSRT